MITTLPKAAKSSGLPYGELLRLVNSGLIRAIRIPERRSWLIETADVETFVEACKVGSAAGSESQPEHTEVAINKQSRERLKTPDIGAKYQWMEKYARKR